MALRKSVWRDISPPLLSSSPEPPDSDVDITPILTSASASKKIQWKRPAKLNDNNISRATGNDLPGLQGTIMDISGDEFAATIYTDANSRQSAKRKIGTSTTVDDLALVDPYSLPVSPTSSRQQLVATSTRKTTSSRMPGIEQSQKHMTRGKADMQTSRNNPKQVAKKSFLDLRDPSQPTPKSVKIRYQNESKAERMERPKNKNMDISDSVGNESDLVLKTQKDSEWATPMPHQDSGRFPIAINSQPDDNQVSGVFVGTHNPATSNETHSSRPNLEFAASQMLEMQLLFDSENYTNAPLKSEHKATAGGRVSSSKQNKGRILSKKRGMTEVGASTETATKKQKNEAIKTTVRPTDGVSDITLPPAHYESTIVRPAITSDPFSALADMENVGNTSFFTDKLLGTATYCKPAKSSSYGEQNLAVSEPRKATSDGLHNEESDVVARQMMSVLTSGPALSDETRLFQSVLARKDTWLRETDPYNETGHILGYFCKTILRFLKLKEDSISDVANEYLHRGTSLNDRIRILHNKEQDVVFKVSEETCLASHRVFHAASHDVRLLVGKLKIINLAPVLNNILDNGPLFVLKTLQTETI